MSRKGQEIRMISSGISKYRGKRVLMLQGPIGPFFRRLSHDLRDAGAEVFKVNFNGGDCIFYPTNYIPFRGSIKEWPKFFETLLTEKKIDVVLLFGDCRRMHQIARKVATNYKVEVGVFEEGYVRPDYLTLDRAGVNGNSLLPRDPEFYFSRPKMKVEPAQSVGQTVPLAIIFSVLYYTAAILLRSFYPKYRHHRPLKFLEGWPLIISFFRKILYRFTERGIQQELIHDHAGKYFLVPLQVYNDSQIVVHSDYLSNADFIEEVVASFAQSAPAETILVIKHHPMDRGYNNYKKDLQILAQKYGLPESRWRYIHDQHLPTLLDHARGVVLVNSTVGLQALHHQCPLKVCGKAIYDIEGLTYRGSIAEFWHKSKGFTVNMDLYERFRNYVINHTQLNGSIYKRLPIEASASGLLWPSQAPVVASEIDDSLPERILEVEEAS